MKLALADDKVDPTKDLVTVDLDVQILDGQHPAAGSAGPGQRRRLEALWARLGLGGHGSTRHIDHVRRSA